MKILSWNILAAEWIKSSYYPQINDKILFNRTARFQRIISIIKNANADIILLQEVMPLEYEMLIKHLQNSYLYSPLIPIKWKYSNQKIGTSGNMTLIRKSNHQFIKPIHYAFEFGIYTELPQIGICNIHLDDLSKQKRINQIKMLEDEILYRKDKVILGGDFNEEYSTNSYIYNLHKFIVHNNECSTYYIDGKMNIDNIMTRGFIAENNKHKCFQYPISMEEGILKYGSDHLPIIVEI
jgi:endonuclease/exonuclease/phosphatase family metal-dependent hydrolase